MKLHKDIIHACVRNFKRRKRTGARGVGTRKKTAYRARARHPWAKGGGRRVRAERKCRPNRSDRRKTHGKKEKSRAVPRTHSQEGKGQNHVVFDRNKQEMLFGTVLTAGEGVRAKGGAFPLMRRRMPRIRRIFYKKGEKFAQIFPPTVCLPKYSTFLRL